eukprot:442416_1
MKTEKLSLENEIENLNEMAQSDIYQQNIQIEKLTQEIIQLGSRNSSLERERDDLMTLLEEREYENQMLKTGFGLHRSKTQAIGSTNVDDMDNIDNIDDGQYTETLDQLSLYQGNSNGPINLEDLEENEESEEYENVKTKTSRSGSPTHKKEEKKQNVADVTREYLHLTASVVKMKFPQRLQHITSEELIKKVRNYQFWEYHDMMVQIMKTAEQKILKKEKEAKQAMLQNQSQQTSGGFLNKFRGIFGGGSSSTNKQKGGGRRSSKHSSGPNRNRNTSSPPSSSSNVGQPKNRKTAPSPPKDRKPYKDRKPKKDEIIKKFDDAKNIIKNQPTHEETKKMAQMEFQGLPDFNATAKASKPDQKL